MRLDLLMAIGVTAFAYLIFLGNRGDYLGHFIAGLGATLGLLTLVLFVTKKPLGWKAVVITLVAIGAGTLVESTTFKDSLFDPVDFCNQSLGACLASAAMLRTTFEVRPLAFNLLVSTVLVIGGFIFAFA